MSWNQLNWKYNETPISFHAVFKNDSDEEITLTNIILYAGTIEGTVGDTDGSSTHIGPLITGNGLPVLLNVNGVTQSVSNKIALVATEYGNSPNLDTTVRYTTALNQKVAANGSADITIVASGGTCLAIKEIAGETSAGGDKPLYTVIYDANGSVFSDGNTQIVSQYREGTEITILSQSEANLNGATRTIKFIGNGGTPESSLVSLHDSQVNWNTQPDRTGTQYLQNQVITVTEDLTLYAEWNRPVIAQFNFPTVQYPGYILECWNTAPDGTGTDIAVGYVVESDVTCYGIWVSTPIHKMTADGWVRIAPESVDTSNKVRRASRKNLRDIAWNATNNVYQWDGKHWIPVQIGSRYRGV